MRRFKISLLALSIVSLVACGGEGTNDSTSEEGTETEASTDAVDTYEQMVELDLTDYDIEAKMYVPDESKGKAELNATDWGSVTINVGKGYGIELVPFGLTVEEKKGELEGDLVYDIEYLEETETAIFYTKTIKEGDMEPEFHFFANAEINGDVVEIKNVEDRLFKKGAVELMMKSARSLK